jgi:hypothetical protein
VHAGSMNWGAGPFHGALLVNLTSTIGNRLTRNASLAALP